MSYQRTQELKLAKKVRQAAKMAEQARLEKEQKLQNKEEAPPFRPMRMLSFLSGKRKFDKGETLGSRRQTASFPRMYKGALVEVFVPYGDDLSGDKKPEFLPQLMRKIRTRKMIGNRNGVRKHELSIKETWVRKPTKRILGTELRLIRESISPLHRSKTVIRRLTAKLIREELAVLEDIAKDRLKSEVEEEIDADHEEAIEIEDAMDWMKSRRQGRGSSQQADPNQAPDPEPQVEEGDLNEHCYGNQCDGTCDDLLFEAGERLEPSRREAEQVLGAIHITQEPPENDHRLTRDLVDW